MLHMKKIFWYPFEILLVILWLFFLNVSVIKEFDQFPSLDSVNGRGWQIALSYVGLALSVLVVLYRKKNLQANLVNDWLRNRWLLIFLAFSAASLFWSVAQTVTLYEVILLICSTFITSYIAVRFRFDGVINILTLFAVIATLISLMIVFLIPEVGIMHRAGHVGSWRGLFWHRNHTGSMMAFFNMIFLLRFLADPVSVNIQSNRRKKVFFAIFYLLTAMHVFGSLSATANILFFALNLFSIFVYFWMKQRLRIKKWHYYAALFVFVAMIFIVGENLEFVFRLLNRDPSMTGRTIMWPDLINNTYLERPFIGHGFATIWMQESFRILIQHRWGWSYQPYFSDNGYIDILLNLGAVGLLIFFYGAAFVVKQVLVLLYQYNSRESFFMLAILVYVFIANISYSFLFEVDYFVWSLLVLAAFLSIRPAEVTRVVG